MARVTITCVQIKEIVKYVQMFPRYRKYLQYVRLSALEVCLAVHRSNLPFELTSMLSIAVTDHFWIHLLLDFNPPLTASVACMYPTVTYSWTVPQILHHSYLVWNLTN